MKTIKNLKIGESYLVFLGYDYSPSGFDIGTFNLSGCLEMQSSDMEFNVDDSLFIYELPQNH